MRPKLNLQKRTVSEAETASPASAVSDSKSSPFGGARPIDTSAREREVEERRQLALRQKREQEKLREEKRLAKEAAAKAERPNAASSPPAAAEEGKSKENGKTKEASNAKENGEGPPPVHSSTSFEVLSRADGDVGSDAARLTTENEHENGEGEVVEDKDVKPQEIVREPAADKKPNAWRTSAADAKPTTADGLEQEGWSTVSKGKNNRRAPNQAARAIAS
jgi:translation initiation factor 4B